MKILMLFVDMLGADYFNLGNSEYPVGSMDKMLEWLGGTLYERCYSPAPDTPRSSACMWTGVYPKENGCNNRLKYPGRYLQIENNLFQKVEMGGYFINLYVRPTINRIGLLPYPYENQVKYKKFDDALKGFDIKNNSLTFFYLPDLHYMMDANGYNMKTMSKGTDIVVRCIEDILDRFGVDVFDYILIFSDHGFRIGRREHLIDNDRVRTMMFLHKRGDAGIVKDRELRSNLDVYPTILDIIGLKSEEPIEGKSLLGKGHEYVLIEDHENFSVKLGQTIEHWAVVLLDGYHWLECDGKWNHERDDTDFDEVYWREIIIEKMDDYEENSRLWKTLHTYDNNKIENNTYTNGKLIKTKIINKGIFKKVKWLYGGFLHAMRGKI